MPPSDGPPLVPSLNLHSSSLRKSSLSSGSSSERRRTSTFRVRYSEDNSNAIPPASSSSEDGDSPPQSARRQSLSLGQLRSSAEGVLLNSNAGSRLNSSEAPHSLRSSLEASRQALRDSAQSAGNETAPERLARITQESSRHSTPLAGPNEVKEEKKVEAEGESSDSDLIEERRNSQYFATVAKVAFNSEEHNIPSLGIGPSVDFFKLMAPSPDAKWKAHPDAATGRGEDPNVGRLQLLIPPTVIYSAYEVMGFFTSEDGYVTRKDDLHRSDIFQMLLPSYSEGRATPVSLTAVNLPVAVQKSRKGRWRTEAQLVLMNELNAYLDSSKLSGNCALQQYVKCAGPKVSARALFQSTHAALDGGMCGAQGRYTARSEMLRFSVLYTVDARPGQVLFKVALDLERLRPCSSCSEFEGTHIKHHCVVSDDFKVDLVFDLRAAFDVKVCLARCVDEIED